MEENKEGKDICSQDGSKDEVDLALGLENW